MEFRIANTFLTSLNKLSIQEQKIIKTKVFDLQTNLSSNSSQFHRIERIKNDKLWSLRVNNNIRIIVYKNQSCILLCYVNHHDNAYEWARKRRIENHPVTGATQIVEIRELIEDVTIQSNKESYVKSKVSLPVLFKNLKKDDLLSIGVPKDWLDDVLNANEETFFNIADYLPQEAAEILLNVASDDISFSQAVQKSKIQNINNIQPKSIGLEHPDSQRRFRIIQNNEELSLALDFPWEQWTIFLHPAQHKYAYKTTSGPTRISGSAGTGKTVVAIHRALALHQKYPNNKILLTTFSKILAYTMKIKFSNLVGKNSSALQKVEIRHLKGVASDQLKILGVHPNIMSELELQNFIKKAIKKLNITSFNIGFLISEWHNIVDAWQLKSWQAYKDVKRLGRNTRIGGSQREKLWNIFDEIWKTISIEKLTTWSSVFYTLSTNSIISSKYQNIIIDESQDISVSELKFVSELTAKKPDGLFFTGDLGQRIFLQPFSWKSLGIDIRGRSHVLKINYRTSHQIRQQADLLLPKEISDLDENKVSRKGTVSLFNSLPPQILLLNNYKEENTIISYWISEQINKGISPHEIGLFVRDESVLYRAKSAILESGKKAFKITDKFEKNNTSVFYGTMHFAKGLEFKSVAVMACDDSIIPQQSRLERITDSSDLGEVYETERQLLYVACTRARENLIVTGIYPGSEFLEDLSVKKD